MKARIMRHCCCVASALLVVAGLHAQDAGHASAPSMGTMTFRGMAGIVTSMTSSQIELSVPEHVVFAVKLSPSTQILQDRTAAGLDQIQVGSAVLVRGTFDLQDRAVQAESVTLMPARGAMILKMRTANYGITWTAGVIAGVQADSISVQRMDGNLQTLQTDARTAYVLRQQPVTRAELRAGERIVVVLDRGNARLADKITIQGMAPN